MNRYFKTAGMAIIGAFACVVAVPVILIVVPAVVRVVVPIVVETVVRAVA
jgi:hypothetical protein